MGRPPKSPSAQQQLSLLLASSNASTSTSTSNNNNGKKKVELLSNLTNNPPNHSSEFVSSHVQFLQRSLDRCDVDIAAIQKLHTRLSIYKNKLLHHPFNTSNNNNNNNDEDVLLDYILHKSSVASSNKEEETNEMEKEWYDMADLFVQHLKLRRRLCNRLARRLNRLSHAMDGQTTTTILPPPPPKYGDSRPLQQNQSIKPKTYHSTIQPHRWNKLQQHKSYNNDKTTDTPPSDIIHDKNNNNNDNNDNTNLPDETKSSSSPQQTPDIPIPSNQESNNNNNKKNEEEQEALALLSFWKEYQQDFEDCKEYEPMYNVILNTQDKTKKFAVLEQNNEEFIKYTNKDEDDFMDEQQDGNIRAGIGATLRSMTAREKVAEWKRWCHDILGRLPQQQPTFSSHKLFLQSQRIQRKQRKQKEAELDRQLKEEMFGTEESSSTTTVITDEDKHNNDTTQKDKDIITPTTENDNNESKQNDETSKKQKQSSKEEQTNDTSHVKVEESKENENVDEAVMADSDDESDAREMFGTSSSSEEEEEEDDDDDDEVMTPTKADTKDGEQDVNEKPNNDAKTTTSTNDATKKEEPALKKRKVFSLKPIPSFYEQDRQRFLMIHADILHTSVHEFARHRIVEATNEYNVAFRKSMDCSNKKSQIEAKWNKMLYQLKVQSQTILNDQAMDLAVARANYQKQKDIFDKKEQRSKNKQLGMNRYSRNTSQQLSEKSVVARSLTSMIDRIQVMNAPKIFIAGTPFLNDQINNSSGSPSRRRDLLTESVATSLAHMVDVAIKRAKAGWMPNRIVDEMSNNYSCNKEKFPDFVPPVKTDVDQTIVDQESGETFAGMRDRMKSLLQKELQDAHNQLKAAEEERKKAWSKLMKTKSELEVQPTSRGRGNRAPVDMTTLPPPPLKGTHGGKAYAVAQAPFTSASTPPLEADSLAANNKSDSKYSAEKVKARIYSDGSVMPVTAPKRNKDGLFQRPAGRKRKGMDWDAHTGRWIPSAE